MAPDLYTVSSSAAVEDQFRAVLVRAKGAGKLAAALRAARWIVEELQRTPHEFGESRYHLPDAELAVRVVVVRPFTVSFGIHERSKTVFVRWVSPAE